MSEIRKFRIIVNLKECGTCSGSSPSSVAKKAVKKLCDGSKKIVKFSLKECKRDCKKECGPYQGHMEKLDKPYNRNGKTITHRVVCEKVRKMRGGRDLVVEDFKNEDSKKYKISIIDDKVYIFFDNFMVFYEHNPTEYFSNVIYVDSNSRSKIKELKINTGKFKLIDNINIKSINDIALKHLKIQLFMKCRNNTNLKIVYNDIFNIFVAELKERGYAEGYENINL